MARFDNAPVHEERRAAVAALRSRPMPRTPKKPPTGSANPTTPPTFAEWQEAAAKELAKHGIRGSAIRHARWRHYFIEGRSPAEAAEHVAAEYDASRPLVRC